MSPRATLHAIGRLSATAALLASPLFGQTIDPTSINLSLPPGELADSLIEVCIPGVDVAKADVFLLADNTASMGDPIATVQAGAALITSTLLGRVGTDIRVGVGNYNDVPPFVPNPFTLQQPITDDETAIIDAINDWTAQAGGDVAESQFYAMHRLVVDPAVNWRPDAKRIIVWFGDSPAHDPICGPLLQLYGEPPVDLTEAVLISELQGAGPFGGTTVIAISTPFSVLIPDALNNDPLGPGGIFGIDYTELGCPQNGVAGQADRIAGATAGISITIPTPREIVDVILDSIDSILTEVTVTAVPFGDIAPFVDVITPPEFVVQLPQDEELSECVTFNVAWEGPPCTEDQYEFTGGINIFVNGNLAGTVDVTISQAECEPVVCAYLFIGLFDIMLPVPQGDETDQLLVRPLHYWNICTDNIPAWDIPEDGALVGLTFYLQVAIKDALTYPLDPIKTSNGLQVVVDSGAFPYGVASGLDLFAVTQPLLGQTFEIDFELNP